MLEDASLYYFIYGSCVYWSCFLLCDVTLKKAISKIAVYLIIAAFYAGIGALYFLTAFSTMTFVEYIIGFLPFIIIPLLYKDSVAKIVYTYFSGMLFCLMLHLSSNILTNHIFLQVQQMNLIQNLTADGLFRILTLALMAIYLLIEAFGIKLAFRKMLKSMTNKVAAISCILPILAFIILLCDYVLLSDLTNMNGNVIALLTLMLLILCIYVVMYVMTTKNGNASPVAVEGKGKPQSVKKELVSDPMDLLASGRHYYEMLLNHYMDMGNRTQNLDTHLQTMNSLLLNDNVAGATVFIDRIAQTFHDHDMVPVCNNESINLLFSYFYYVCKKENIYLETHINLPNGLPIPDLDLCILFGNCMENAIEACRFVKDGKNRFINVDCKIQNANLMIIMDNSFDGFINKVNNQLKTRKKFGGIGLKTVQAVVGKYRGSIDMEYPQNVFSIFLKLQLSPGNAPASASPNPSTAGKENRRERKRAQ